MGFFQSTTNIQVKRFTPTFLFMIRNEEQHWPFPMDFHSKYTQENVVLSSSSAILAITCIYYKSLFAMKTLYETLEFHLWLQVMWCFDVDCFLLKFQNLEEQKTVQYKSKWDRNLVLHSPQYSCKITHLELNNNHLLNFTWTKTKSKRMYIHVH